MRRREFIGLVGGAAAWPLAARAQQRQMPRVGVLMGNAESDPQGQEMSQAFRTRLSQLGWVDGDNVRIDYRWAAAHADRLITLRDGRLVHDAAPGSADEVIELMKQID